MRLLLISLAIALIVAPAPAQQQSSPVQVVVASPVGSTRTLDQTQVISVTFNQPMVPLREVPADEGSGPMTISPAPKGKYRWQGTTTLSFMPEGKLPYSTKYRITIPAGTKSVLGQTLATSYEWEFETPRPLLVSHEPYDKSRFIELDHSILLQFNQPVDPQAISKFISLEERTSREYYPGYTAQRADSASLGRQGLWYRRRKETKPEELLHYVLIIPREPFLKGANITVRVKAGLMGMEGPLPMPADAAFSFSTFNEFSFLGTSNEENFNPSAPLVLRFSNPVSFRDLAHHLAFNPPVKIEEAEYDYSAEEFRLSLPFQAETQYTGFILPGLQDRFGQTLKDTARFHFRTGSFLPTVRMTTGQGVLEANESHQYPITFINIDSVLLQMGRVSPDKVVEVMQRMDYSYYQQLAWNQAVLTWMDRTSEGAEQFSFSKIWNVKVPHNQRTLRPIDLDQVLGKAHRGIVLVQVDNLLKENSHRYLKALVQVTNLGITGKFSPENNLVWVTNLKDASPVAGASVEVRDDSNRVMWKGVTDAKGFAKSPGWGLLGMESKDRDEEWYEGSRQPRQWIVVRYNDDVAFSSSDWNDGIQPWVFNVPYEWNPKVAELSCELFTDRGLYKTGERVEMKGIVRELRGGAWRIPSQSADLEFKVRNSRNEEIFSARPKVSPFGSFAVGIDLKPNAPLGYYAMQLSVRLKVSGRKGSRVTKGETTRPVATGTFRVEAFRPAEFEVQARFGKASYILGDTLKGYIQASYLFGGAMKEAPLKWRISANASSWEPEGFEGYFFGPQHWLSRYQQPHELMTSGEQTLDENGHASVEYAVKGGELQGPQSVMLEGDVTSSSRQVVSGRTSVLVHGGEYYIGIQPSGTFVKTDSAMRYAIIAVDTGGRVIAGERLSLKLYERIWRSVRRAETGGRYYWESQVEDIGVDSAFVLSMGSPVVRTYTPTKAGFYYLDCSGQDKRANRIHTQAYFYVSGSSYVPWERSNDDRIELIADKKNYKPGETASIIVKSPYERAPALISIEREGVIRHYSTTLVGSAPQVDILIEREYLPNVFVSVVLLQGRVEGAAITREADVGRPSFKIGYINLSVSPAEKQLRVVVVPDRKEYRPGDTVEVAINTKTADGKPISAEVTLSVADLGVLNLIAYRMPNPFQLFYRQRGLAITTSESRIHLVQQRDYGEKGEEEGGGGAETGEAGLQSEGIRKDFRPSAYWNPSVLTSDAGIAKVRFKLPDNLTSFEAMAVAHTKMSDFGYGEASFLVNKRLLLQPALPRFARLGDQFEGGVLVTNYTQKEQTIHLVATAMGITMKGGDTLAFALRQGQSKEARMKFSADRVGTATFIFKGWTGQDQDGVQWKIPVEVPRLREAVALYASTTGEAHEKIQIPTSVFRELGNLECTVASTAMVGLSGGISYLFDYPYGCLEQRLSRVLPMILAKDLVEAFKFEVLSNKDYREVVRSILDEIPLFQQSDGGFAYWKNTDYTWPYLSAFAMYTLLQAKQHGYDVDASVITAGIRYLREVLDDKHPLSWYSEYAWRCTRALIVYTLALNGTPDFGTMDRLYGERDKLPLFARSYLLKAFSAAKGNPGMISDLARDLTNAAKVAPTSAHFEDHASPDACWVFDSNARTTALILQALVETQPENSLIPKVVRWLIDEQKKKGCWRTTQENLYVVDALATYFRVYEREEPNFQTEVRLAGGTMLKEIFRGRSFAAASRQVPLGELVEGADYPVDFSKDGTGRLYYTLRMNYYPKGQTKAKEEGIGVLKSVENLKATSDSLGTIGAGAVTRVTITVTTNQARNFVVVDDPVPAGFEIINTSFQTTSTAAADQERGGVEWGWSNPFRHQELKDDRALFFAEYLPAGVWTMTYQVRATSYGTYQMPATSVEGMYEPEVFGQTASKVVRVE